MLQTLAIENVALVEKVTLNFDSKLNVISGETGAGKSIMLDSLSFVFGGRADKTLIRSGANYMKVDAVFSEFSASDVQFLRSQLGEMDFSELFVSRSLDTKGKNVCKINGELIPLATLKKVCAYLVDIHGQSEHLAILDNEYQLDIIDLFSQEIEKPLAELNQLIDKIKSVDAEISMLGGSESEKQNLIDLYTYQINEISNENIKSTEFEDLTSERNEMRAYEKVNENLSAASTALTKSDFGQNVIDSLAQALHSVRNISDVKTNYKELENRLNSSLIEISDISETINEQLKNNSFDENRFNFVETRLDKIKQMFRKYGGDYSAMMSYFNDISSKLDSLINSSERYNKLSIEKQNLLEKISKKQAEITKLRKISAQKLSAAMQNELLSLGMKNAKLNVKFSKIAESYSRKGADHVEFMFSANLGFEPKPLNKVVSGGEMSRVMLAYKIVVSKVDSIHTIVFDEIDTGLSGHIASVVAGYMARLSVTKQIIAVSHLPQICAMADKNIKVEKQNTKSTTITNATVLTGKDLFEEIARLMGASSTEVGVAASKQLKAETDKFKTSLKA